MREEEWLRIEKRKKIKIEGPTQCTVTRSSETSEFRKEDRTRSFRVAVVVGLMTFHFDEEET